MYRLTSAFIYEGRKTWVHELDPRSKLILSATVMLISILSESLLIQILVWTGEMLISFIGKELRKFLNSALLVLPFSVFILLINYVFGRGLMASITLSLRLVAMVGAFSIFFALTPPEDFILMLESLKVPALISFSFSLALRFIPVMAEETQRIIDAQRSRGLKVDSRNPIRRLKMMMPIFIPLIILSIKKSMEVAEALETRCFDPNAKRTSIIELKMTMRDYLIIALSLAILLAYFILKCSI